MQRAAASSPQTPHETPPEPPNKRQKLANVSPGSAKGASSMILPSNETTENQKLEQTLARLAAEAGDEKWTLNSDSTSNRSVSSKYDIHITNVGYNTIDFEEPSNERRKENFEPSLPSPKPRFFGRKSFGKFNKKIEVSPYSKLQEIFLSPILPI